MKETKLLRPRLRLHVMDLVSSAGIDVSDWKNFRGGIKKAKSNPKYCYNWAFVNSDVVVLNLWYDQIIEEGDRILVRDNMRFTSLSISTKPIWKKRATQFDEALQYAYKNQLVIRVILNEGYRREGNSKDTAASRVSFRLLDPKPWTIIMYDYNSGHFTLQRQAPIFLLVDQFSIDQNDQSDPAKRVVRNNEVFHRSPIVRQLALERAGGKCEYCGQKGFVTNKGYIFLETHHVIPLSEKGPDNILNVVALCPNHHREAHYGTQAKVIQSFLLKLLNN